MAIFDKASTAAARTKAFSKINPEGRFGGIFWGQR